MGLLDIRGLQEGGNIVRGQFCRICGLNFIRFARAANLERETRKVLGILGQLEGTAGMIGGQEWNENERFPSTLPVVVYRNVIGFDLGMEPSRSPTLAQEIR